MRVHWETLLFCFHQRAHFLMDIFIVFVKGGYRVKIQDMQQVHNESYSQIRRILKLSS